jgi:hypothetical protein
MTHVPQVKSIRIDVSELGLLLFLNRILYSTPYFIVPNLDQKNLVNRRVEYPAEKRDSCRHDSHEENLLTTVYSTQPKLLT